MLDFRSVRYLHGLQTASGVLDVHETLTRQMTSQPQQQLNNTLKTEDQGESLRILRDDNFSSSRDAGRLQAHTAWKRCFNVRQLNLGRDDPEIFTPGRRLGGGGIGIVHETSIDGIPLALKRTYTRRLNDHQLNEIKILGRISEKRHHHIVELVGSYCHRQRIGYKLGVLLWPVASCDLAIFLHDLDTLHDRVVASKDNRIHDTDHYLSTEALATLLDIELDPIWTDSITPVLEAAKTRLASSFGCISKAIAYLHGHNIRHKDLKPSQILLSPRGLWLTDFGWSNDMSDFTHSATSDGDNITTKYQAPERANRQPCGRSEDVFGLGCVFLEMSVYVIPELLSQRTDTPWSQEGWSFHTSLEVIYHLFDAVSLPSDHPAHGLDRLIVRMLAYNPDDRPMIDNILHTLSGFSPWKLSAPYSNRFFGNCCQRRGAMSLTCK
jgi:serine/threonine protein kinase